MEPKDVSITCTQCSMCVISPMKFVSKHIVVPFFDGKPDTIPSPERHYLVYKCVNCGTTVAVSEGVGS